MPALGPPFTRPHAQWWDPYVLRLSTRLSEQPTYASLLIAFRQLHATHQGEH